MSRVACHILETRNPQPETIIFVNKLVEIHSVDAAYDGEIILKDVNLDIFSDDFIGIIGPNGGGKTTLIKIILKLIKPIRGSVKYYNNDDSISNRFIGYLPQVNLIDKKFPISVLDVVLSGLVSKKNFIKRTTPKERSLARDIIHDLGISHLEKKTIGELSGGEMQRVFLARAIISSPRLLILDEPNTFVDNKFEHDLYEALKELSKKMAILIVSHDIGMITSYIKTIACVNRKLHYHESNIITEKQLQLYDCPIQLITHGKVPHTVLKEHSNN